jgi:hypothetical protein
MCLILSFVPTNKNINTVLTSQDLTEKDIQIWCMCVRASYMKLTRDTHLMQQFIYYYK